MSSPDLDDLPMLEGKTGWPWAEAGLQASDTQADSRPWPRVSIVTASYNQAEFIEEAVRSVLLQGYPNLEYIVMDGGSTDGSVEIIKKYEPWLGGWASGPDGGQAAAINQGFSRASGEILSWLNADDLLLPGAVVRAVKALAANPQAVLTHGACVFANAAGRVIEMPGIESVLSPTLENLLKDRDGIWQPGTFFRREALLRAGLLDERLYFSMDYELWIRLRKVGEFTVHADGPAAVFRLQPGAKTHALPLAMIRERYEVSRRHGGDGVTAALKTLRLRWEVLTRADGSFGLETLAKELASSEYRSLPAGLRWAARSLTAELFAAVGFDAARRGRPRRAAVCLAKAAIRWPALLANRGVLSILVEGTVGARLMPRYRRWRMRERRN